MATIKVCDRCGYTINPVNSGSIVSIVTSARDHMLERDLCVSCAYKVKKVFGE